MALVKTWEIITAANSGAMNTALHANKVANPDSWQILGFACKSDGSAFYTLVTYRT